MAEGEWLGAALQRVGYKGPPPPESLFASAELEPLRELICGLTRNEAFTQEELAAYKRLEDEKKALQGSDLHQATSELGEDPRQMADSLSAVSDVLKGALERAQRRCELLNKQRRQLSSLCASTKAEGDALRLAADAEEKVLESEIASTLQALQQHEQDAVSVLGVCTEMATSQLAEQLFSSLDLASLVAADVDFALAASRSAETVLRDLQSNAGGGANWEELRRLKEAHFVSRFGSASADAECAAAEAELQHLEQVAERGAPEAELPPSELREAIAHEKRQADALKKQVQTASLELLRLVQTAWVNPGTQALESVLDSEESRLKAENGVVEDVLHFQRQWWACRALSHAWLDAEYKAVNGTIDRVHVVLDSVEANAQIVHSRERAYVAARRDHDEVVNEYLKLCALADPFTSVDPREAEHMLWEVMATLQHDITKLEDAIDRYSAEDRAATATLNDANQQLFSCFETGQGSESHGKPFKKPTTYFEQDLNALGEAVDASSQRLLDAMQEVEAKRGQAGSDWGAPHPPAAQPVHRQQETPVPSSPPLPTTPPQQPARSHHSDPTPSASGVHPDSPLNPSYGEEGFGKQGQGSAYHGHPEHEAQYPYHEAHGEHYQYTSSEVLSDSHLLHDEQATPQHYDYSYDERARGQAEPTEHTPQQFDRYPAHEPEAPPYQQHTPQHYSQPYHTPHDEPPSRDGMSQDPYANQHDSYPDSAVRYSQDAPPPREYVLPPREPSRYPAGYDDPTPPRPTWHEPSHPSPVAFPKPQQKQQRPALASLSPPRGHENHAGHPKAKGDLVYQPTPAPKSPPKKLAFPPRQTTHPATPAFLLRSDGTRMTASEYKQQNRRLLQELQ